MKKLFLVVFVLISGVAITSAQEPTGVPRESEAVMLQAFHWNSYQSSGTASNNFGCTRWINLVRDSIALRDNFDVVWLPPSAEAGGVGYYPKCWSNQDSDWGSRAMLTTLIAALHRGGTQVVADMVLNHHQSRSGFARSFSTENFGQYGTFTIAQNDICYGDEAFTNKSSECYGASYRGASDTGDNDGGCRDLDHTSEHVQNMVKAYAQWMRTEMGYDGFRYDMVKGYHGRYVKMYNEASQPTFSVGEYFDGNIESLHNYINSTGRSTLVFDFAAKYAVFNRAISSSGYNMIMESAGNMLYREKDYRRYAVTFIDNHDTFNRSADNKDEFMDATGTGQSVINSSKHAKVLEANAYLLSMPGIPCVFWPHWNKFRNEINAMIAARKLAGVHNESDVIEEKLGTFAYEAVVQGHRGLLMIRLGLKRDKNTPDGYTKCAGGANYDMYVKPLATPVVNTTGDYVPEVNKTLEDGRIVIGRGNRKYSIQGQLLK